MCCVPSALRLSLSHSSLSSLWCSAQVLNELSPKLHVLVCFHTYAKLTLAVPEPEPRGRSGTPIATVAAPHDSYEKFLRNSSLFRDQPYAFISSLACSIDSQVRRCCCCTAPAMFAPSSAFRFACAVF